MSTVKLELIDRGIVVKTRKVECDDGDAQALLIKESQHDPLAPGHNTFGTWVQVTVEGQQ